MCSARPLGEELRDSSEGSPPSPRDGQPPSKAYDTAVHMAAEAETLANEAILITRAATAPAVDLAEPAAEEPPPETDVPNDPEPEEGVDPAPEDGAEPEPEEEVDPAPVEGTETDPEEGKPEDGGGSPE